MAISRQTQINSKNMQRRLAKKLKTELRLDGAKEGENSKSQGSDGDRHREINGVCGQSHCGVTLQKGAGGEKDDVVQRMVALRVILRKVLVEFQCVESMLTLTTRGNTEEDLLRSTGQKY